MSSAKREPWSRSSNLQSWWATSAVSPDWSSHLEISRHNLLNSVGPRFFFFPQMQHKLKQHQQQKCKFSFRKYFTCQNCDHFERQQRKKLSSKRRLLRAGRLEARAKVLAPEARPQGEGRPRRLFWIAKMGRGGLGRARDQPLGKPSCKMCRAPENLRKAERMVAAAWACSCSSH